LKSEALLTGRIFDDRGNRMSPSHARKGGIKYRYYLSSALLRGVAERAGSVPRVPAVDIETLVVRLVREHLKLTASMDDRSLINDHVARVEVRSEQLVIQLVQPVRSDRRSTEVTASLRVPWQKTPSKRCRQILLPATVPAQDARPIRSETRQTLVASIARGRRWLDELIADAKATAQSIANRERCSVRQVNMIISLAFLAPNLVMASRDYAMRRSSGRASTRCWASLSEFTEPFDLRTGPPGTAFLGARDSQGKRPCSTRTRRLRDQLC
jgi:hypothetical protein